MTPEAILAHPARALPQEQRERYFRDGYLLVPEVVPAELLSRLMAAHDAIAAQALESPTQDRRVDFCTQDETQSRQIRRVRNPFELHEVFWEVVVLPALTSIMADLVGPDVKFDHQRLHYKHARDGEGVKWHQDSVYQPYTCSSVLKIGVFLSAITRDQGPLTVVPGSHRGELFDPYDAEGRWVGYLTPPQLERVDLGSAVELVGPAGTVSIHDTRTVHGSRPNLSERPRPLLFINVCSADAVRLDPGAYHSSRRGEIIVGSRPRALHVEPGVRHLPPDFSRAVDYNSPVFDRPRT